MSKIAILDSGYRVDNLDLKNGVKNEKIFFSSVAGTKATIDDTFGHGSHCTSLIGGRNKNQITSCAPLAQLFIAKVCSQGSVRSWSVIVDAIKWAIDNAVDIISISYGGEERNDDLEKIINSAFIDHNILVISAIGDNTPNSRNLPCFPALFENCLAVGATNNQNRIAPVTTVSSKIGICAPGENVLGYWVQDQLIPKTGTSQAAAIAGGVAALCISHHKKLGKKFSAKSIRNLLTETGEKVIDNENFKIISPLKIFDKIKK